MDYQLLALEKRERFMAIKDRIAALYHGDKRKAFLQHLEDAEYALVRLRRRARRAQRSSRPSSSTATTTSSRYFLGETHFNEGEAERGARLLLARPRGQAGPLRGPGLLAASSATSGATTTRAEELPASAPWRSIPDALPAALQPRRRLRRRRATSSRAVAYLERRLRDRPGAAGALPARQLLLRDGQARGRAMRCLQEAVRARSGVRGGAPPARARLPRPALEQEGARLLPRRRSGSIRKKTALPGPGALPLGPRRARRCPRSSGEAAELAAPAPRSYARARQPEAGARRLPAGARARAGEPDAADVVRPALPAPRPRQEIEARDAQGARPATPARCCAPRPTPTLIEALRSRGQVPRGQPHRQASCSTRALRTSPDHRLLRDGLQPGGDGGGPRRGARLRAPVARAGARTSSSSSRSPRSAGCTTSARSSTRRSTSSRSRTSSAPSPTTLTHLGMALLAAGEEERARSCLRPRAQARAARRALEEQMMECMKDSARLLERVGSRQ